MYCVRRTQRPVQRCPRESRSRIGNYESGEPEIAGHPGRSRNAVVRREPNQDERVDSIVAQISFIKGVEEIGPNRAGLFINLIPVFGTFLSVMIIGETLHLYQIIALLLALGGIAVAERKKPPVV